MYERFRVMMGLMVVSLVVIGSTLVTGLPALVVAVPVGVAPAPAVTEVAAREIWALLVAGDEAGVAARLTPAVAERELWADGAGGQGENWHDGLLAVLRWVQTTGKGAVVTGQGTWPRKPHATLDVVSVLTDRGRVDLFLRITDGTLVKIWIGPETASDPD